MTDFQKSCEPIEFTIHFKVPRALKETVIFATMNRFRQYVACVDLDPKTKETDVNFIHYIIQQKYETKNA